jgi:sugar (pentulose or hexulose) kinase
MATTRCDFREPPPARRSPLEWWDVLAGSVTSLPAHLKWRVGAVAVTSARGAVAGFDAEGSPVTPGYADFDSGAVDHAHRLDELAGGSFLSRTGCPAFPLAGLPKMMLHAGAVGLRWWGGPQDFALWRLTGRRVMSIGSALRLGVLTSEGDALDESLVRAAGLDPKCFPPLVPVGGLAGELRDETAQAIGLQPGIPVAAAPGDVPAALFATGAEDGRVVVNLGTTIVATTPIRQPWPVDLTREILPGGRRSAETGSGAGGVCVDWLAGLLGVDPSEVDRLSAGMQQSAGLRFDPVMVDVWGSGQGGTLSGITPQVGRAQLAVAVMRGVAEAAVGAVEELQASCGRVNQVILTGGLAGSRHLTSLIDARLEPSLMVLAGRELAAEGAAATAAQVLSLCAPPA